MQTLLPHFGARPHALIACTILLTLTLSACKSTYSREIKQAQDLSLRGDLEDAVEALNQQLEVEDTGHTPDKLDHNKALLLLERATLLQAQGQYRLSSRDMIIVDDRLEWLDIDKTSVKDLSKRFYSAHTANYQAPPYERLLLNTLNQINYLVDNDLEDARVEARRFRLLEKYFIDEQNNILQPELLALGNYLSGATFESSGDYGEALVHYSKAWQFGLRDEETRHRLIDLHRVTNRTTPALDELFFEELLAEARGAGPLTRKEYFERNQLGDTLVIVQFGFAPYKEPVNIPIHTARTRAGIETHTGGASVNAIHFPEMTSRGLPVRSLSSARVRVNDKPLALTQGMHVSEAVTQAWKLLEPKLISAAILRAESRELIGEGGRQVSSQATATNPLIGVLGWIAATSTQTALSAADQPDTRSWTTLPAYIRIARTQLPEGLHTIESNVHGSGERQIVPVWSNKLNVVNFSKAR